MGRIPNLKPDTTHTRNDIILMRTEAVANGNTETIYCAEEEKSNNKVFME